MCLSCVERNCNAPGVVGVESDAGNREFPAILCYLMHSRNTGCSKPNAPNTGEENSTVEYTTRNKHVPLLHNRRVQ